MRIIGLELLKKLGWTLAAIILGMALVNKILAGRPDAGAGLFAALLLASPLAYLIRESRRRRPARHPMRRARERTRVAGHLEEE